MIECCYLSCDFLDSTDVFAVFGATGISGTACLQTLLKTPSSEYKSILAVSRRPPSIKSADGRIKHVNVDLMGSVDEIAKGLKDAGGEEAKHVFFYSYIAKEEEEDLVETNKKLFGNVSRLNGYHGQSSLRKFL